jgi:hypothetical protein
VIKRRAKIGEKLWKNRLSLMGFIPGLTGCPDRVGAE